MNPLASDLVQKEYNKLCEELASMLNENNQLARYAIILVTSLCTIIVTHPTETAPYHYFLKPLPFVVAMMFSFRVFALYKRGELISRYLESNYERGIVQKDFPELGWETYLNNNIRKAKPSRSFAQVSFILFWALLDLLSLVFIFL